MDHETVEREEVVERYLRGRLPEEERARFEEHYLSCAECLDRLELAEAMQRGFQRAAAQDVAQAVAARQLVVVAWLARLGRARQLAVLAMALCAAVLLPTGLALWRTAGPSREAPGQGAGSGAEVARRRLDPPVDGRRRPAPTLIPGGAARREGRPPVDSRRPAGRERRAHPEPA